MKTTDGRTRSTSPSQGVDPLQSGGECVEGDRTERARKTSKWSIVDVQDMGSMTSTGSGHAGKPATQFDKTVMDLIRSADECMTDDADALQVANSIDDFLNKQALLSRLRTLLLSLSQTAECSQRWRGMGN